MENNNIVRSNNQKVVMILTIVIILLLVVIVALGMVIANKEYKYCNDNTKQDKVDEYIDEVIKNNQDEYDVYINILSMNKPDIMTGEGLSHHLYITGNMRLSFNEENFHVVGLEGYCLGEENEKYMIYGPKGSEITFNNGDTIYELVETINDENGDLIYPDGTKKSSSEIDWKNVKIKSCKIEKLYTVYNINGKSATGYTEINYEKQFD